LHEGGECLRPPPRNQGMAETKAGKSIKRTAREAKEPEAEKKSILFFFEKELVTVRRRIEVNIESLSECRAHIGMYDMKQVTQLHSQ
jgi:hypothetical protein